jgi:hypothetical protein
MGRRLLRRPRLHHFAFTQFAAKRMDAWRAATGA